MKSAHQAAPERPQSAQPRRVGQPGACGPKSPQKGSEAVSAASLRAASVADRADLAANSEDLPEATWIALATDPSPRVRALTVSNVHAPDSARVAAHLTQ